MLRASATLAAMYSAARPSIGTASPAPTASGTSVQISTERPNMTTQSTTRTAARIRSQRRAAVANAASIACSTAAIVRLAQC